jgi:hypothetical protein
MQRKILLFAVLLSSFACSLYSQIQMNILPESGEIRLTPAQQAEIEAAQAKARAYVEPKLSPRVVLGAREVFVVEPNVRVYPSTTVWQSEVPITRHPTNPNIMYASSNAVRFSPQRRSGSRSSVRRTIAYYVSRRNHGNARKLLHRFWNVVGEFCFDGGWKQLRQKFRGRG